MKDLITTIASILILMLFVLQFTANQTTYIKMMGVEHSVRMFRMLSGQQSEFHEADINAAKNEIARILKCSPAQVRVETEDSGRYRISAPVYGAIGPAAALGMQQEDNFFLYQAEGSVVFQDEEPDDYPGIGDSDDHAAAIPDRDERADVAEPEGGT